MTLEFKDILDTVLNKEQLDIYEKMCLLILLNMEEEVNMTSEELGNYMGCSAVRARLAYESLSEKGYLRGEGHTSVPEPISRRESNIISTEQSSVMIGDIRETMPRETDDFLEGFFKADVDVAEEDQADERLRRIRNLTGQGASKAGLTMGSSMETEVESEAERRQRLAAYLLGGDDIPDVKPFVSVKHTKESLVDQVIDLIDEKISFKEANIILGFAKNDLDLIRRKYRMAKMSQMTDTISVLINELQKKESTVIKADDIDMENSQINTSRIMKMQAYKNQQK